MSLCSWHILLLGVVCSLILFTNSHGNFSVHFSNVLLFTRLPEWAVGFCALSNELFTISLTKSKAISVLSVTESFKTLFKIDLAIFFCFWCGILPIIVEDCIFRCIILKICLGTDFHLRVITRSFNLNCVNCFFNCLFMQIRCLFVSL